MDPSPELYFSLHTSKGATPIGPTTAYPRHFLEVQHSRSCVGGGYGGHHPAATSPDNDDICFYS